MERNKIISIMLFILALSISILTTPPKTSITYDEALYIDIARNLASGLSNFTYQGVYMMYRPPLYPYTLSIFYRIFEYGTHLTIARLISSLFYALTSILVYSFVIELFGDKKRALLASLFYIFNPLAFAMSSRALVHSEFTFFYTLSLFFLYKGRKNGEKPYIYLSFLSAGLAILTRYTGLSIVGVIFAYLYLVEHWEWMKRREYYIGIAVLALTLLPWLYMGHTYYGGVFRPFTVASRVVTLDKPSSAFEYLSLVTKALSMTFIGLMILGFVKQRKDERGWLLLSWAFIGLMGILTVVHKEVRFLTFLSPVMAIYAEEGIYFLYGLSIKFKPSISARTKSIILLILLLLLLIPKIPNALEYKTEEWDSVNYQETGVLTYIRAHYNVTRIMVSPRMYTLAGFFFPEAEVDQIITYPKMKRGIVNGYYDIIVYKEGDLLWEEIESSDKYILTKEFYGGKFKVFIRKS
ncbi:ArnT family glycosyltransferase [Palaeococcus sp. (in: euryarchaeotes)]